MNVTAALKNRERVGKCSRKVRGPNDSEGGPFSTWGSQEGGGQPVETSGRRNSLGLLDIGKRVSSRGVKKPRGEASRVGQKVLLGRRLLQRSSATVDRTGEGKARA